MRTRHRDTYARREPAPGVLCLGRELRIAECYLSLYFCHVLNASPGPRGIQEPRHIRVFWRHRPDMISNKILIN